MQSKILADVNQLYFLHGWSFGREGPLFGGEETTELFGNYSHDLEQTEAMNASVLNMCPVTCWSLSPPIPWCLAGYNVCLWSMYGIEWGELRGGWKGDWAHVGVGGCKTSRRKQEGELNETALSVTTVCLFAECL